MKTQELYIGLMSGTSLDAIDVALIHFNHETPQLLETHQHEMPADIRASIMDLCYPSDNDLQKMGELDVKLGYLFSDSINALLKKTHFSKKNIRAIGSHGQTIRHMPHSKTPFTIQIGDPNIIAAQTGITTVADFRRRDMALGGQAAPLAPAFHDFLFQHRTENVGVLNIGGIANVTFLPANKKEAIIAFDTGPGNTLMDSWCLKHLNRSYDEHGKWALSGNINEKLLMHCLADAYFQKQPPKSTGREYFHLGWLPQKILNDIQPADVQATLLELTAQSIVNAVLPFEKNGMCVYVCGGGARNTALMDRLKKLSRCDIKTTESLGIHPDWMEAAAFAWLARQTLSGKPGNIPSVTGARAATILGAIYPG